MSFSCALIVKKGDREVVVLGEDGLQNVQWLGISHVSEILSCFNQTEKVRGEWEGAWRAHTITPYLTLLNRLNSSRSTDIFNGLFIG